jgi:hypothetical protein
LSLRPKSAEQCIELQNSADRRLWPVARYAYQLREMDWDFKLQWPFEVLLQPSLGALSSRIEGLLVCASRPSGRKC